MSLDIEQIKADLAAGRLDQHRISKLIIEVERLAAELATARNAIVNLLGENRALRAELRRKEPTPPSFNKELDGEEL